MEKFWLVFLGGGVGSLCRFLLSGWVLQRLGPDFPYGTLTVNLIGCFAIGLLAGYASTGAILTPQTRLLLMVGFLGGLTTFSAYCFESFNLLQEGLIARALVNLGGSVIAGMLAVLAGHTLVRFVFSMVKGG